MTVSDLGRLHSQLSKLEDMFPGYLTEIVEGGIVANPVKPFHGKTIQRLWSDLEGQLPSGRAVVGDVAFLFDDDNEFCPRPRRHPCRGGGREPECLPRRPDRVRRRGGLAGRRPP
ncbi:hypothetical protein ACIPJS_32505 [Streptomyces sp. NPDC086783]|uniref:hypothetical protein n=1 Tax=Streptomyces sp. NPDC086783 TaxID=3365758 RepID=UPI003828E75D